MAAIYDTELIRQAAGKVRMMSTKMDEEAAYALRRARENLDDLTGQTAEAWDESLELRLKAVRSDALRLSEIAARLRAYANALDGADQRLADLMGGRG